MQRLAQLKIAGFEILNHGVFIPAEDVDFAGVVFHADVPEENSVDISADWIALVGRGFSKQTVINEVLPCFPFDIDIFIQDIVDEFMVGDMKGEG